MPRPETVRAIRGTRVQRRRQRRFVRYERPVLLAGALALPAALPLPWLFGGSGLDLVAGPGTLWELRFAAALGPLLALAAVAFVARRRGAEFLLILVALALGAGAGFLFRWDPAALRAGFWLSGLGALLVLVGCWETGRARQKEPGSGAVGGAARGPAARLLVVRRRP